MSTRIQHHVTHLFCCLVPFPPRAAWPQAVSVFWSSGPVSGIADAEPSASETGLTWPLTRPGVSLTRTMWWFGFLVPPFTPPSHIAILIRRHHHHRLITLIIIIKGHSLRLITLTPRNRSQFTPSPHHPQPPRYRHTPPTGASSRHLHRPASLRNTGAALCAS